MKIPSSQSSPLRSASSAGRAQRSHPSPTAERSEATRMADPGRGADDATRGSSVTERLEALGEEVATRLATLSRETGADLSGVESAFEEKLGRILQGLADGSLDRVELDAAIQHSLRSLEHDVEARLGGDGDRSEGRSGEGEGQEVTRLEAFADATLARLREVGDADAARLFGSGVERLYAGVADGSLDTRGLASGLQNLLAQVQDGLGEGEPSGEDPGARFDSVVADLQARLGALDLPRGSEDAAAALEAEFAQAMERLGSAFFEEGAMDRTRFERIFGSLVDGLGEDLQRLLGAEGEDPRATLYDPVAGLERLGGRPGGLDATV